MASFPQAFLPTPCAHIYPLPYAPHALPTQALIDVIYKYFDNFFGPSNCYLYLGIKINIRPFTEERHILQIFFF
jgi:hypothetical protein